ncbi:SDR family oxidoreductase, partial [Salmonella enterica]|nr:SDR family oxidoreductase [Salmonella enterica]
MHNKICIVTGAAQGIGRKVVELFSQAGAAKIYACDIKHGNNEKFKNVIPVT